MAFPEIVVPTPTAIADIEVRLFSPDPTGTGTPSADYSVQVIYSDGSMRVLTGNLVPHLTQGQINSLLSFMASLRVQANDQILP